MANGQAVVLDNPRDPMALVLMGQQQQAAQRYRQAQLGLQQQKADTAELNKALAYQFEKPEDRFQQWGQDLINKANDEVFNYYRNNVNADSLTKRQGITQIQGRFQKQLDYGREVVDLFKTKQKSLDGFKDILNKKEADRIMTQIISKDDPFQVDRDLLENIEQVPAIYDLNAIVANSVEDIKGQIRTVSESGLKESPLGLFMEIRENKMRFKDIDKTMDFLLRGDDVTDLGIQQKINGGMISDGLRYDIAKREVAAAGGNPEDVTQVFKRFKEIQYDPKYAPQVRKELRGILEQFQQEDRDVKIQSMGKFKQASMTEQLKENRILARDKVLQDISNPYATLSDTTPKKESQAALSRILGGDFGGGKVTEAKFNKGNVAVDPEYMKQIVSALNEANFDTNESTRMQKMSRVQQLVRDAKNHMVQKTGNKIELSIKTGTIFGDPKETSGILIDLSDPSWEAIVNALMNANAGESKIPLDDVHFVRNKRKQSASTGFLDDDDEEEFLDD